MKKILLLVLVLVAAWIGVNYVRTGEFTLLPVSASAEERHLRDLEKELADVNAQIGQAGRMAGMTGMDTTADVAGLVERKTRLEKEIAEAKKKAGAR